MVPHVGPLLQGEEDCVQTLSTLSLQERTDVRKNPNLDLP